MLYVVKLPQAVQQAAGGGGRTVNPAAGWARHILSRNEIKINNFFFFP